MIYLLAVISIIAIVFVGFDLALSFKEWQARIHIGRWSDRRQWQEALEGKARKWLRKSPTVKISDNNRWVLYDMLRGRYRSRTIQAWQDAGLLFGLGKEDSALYASRNIDSRSGEWKRIPKHADAALLAYMLKKNDALPAEAEEAILDLLLVLKRDQKTIPYRAGLPNIRFVDTIGMAAPFLSLCGEADVATAQIEEYDKALLADSCLPPHAYDMERKVPLGIFDWSRGTGWYILGLIESNTAGEFSERIVGLATELLRYQKPEGGFGAMLFNEKSTFESSGSALIGLLMLRAYEIHPDPRFLAAAFKTEKRLMSATRRNGALDYCQGDTKGIGYYSHTFSIMPFAQGVALRLSKELNKYANG